MISTAGGTPRARGTRGHAAGRARTFGVLSAGVLAVGIVATVAPLLVPALRLSVFDPGLRTVLEVSGAAVVVFAALILAIPAEGDVRPARNAFAAALVVLAAANGVSGLLSAFADDLTAVSQLAFYPWLAARYVAVVFFVCAGLERPQASLARYLLAGIAVLSAAEGAVLVLGGHLPAVLELRTVPAPHVAVIRPALHAALQGPPLVLFGVGAWLAGRRYVHGAGAEYAWLSLALTVQVVAQANEVLFPAFLGPILRSTDVLRLVSFGLLSGSAFAQMRRLYRDRSHAVDQQDRALRSQHALTERLRAFAEQEADFRAIVTHELASPIATIRAFGHAARRRSAGCGEPDLQRVLDGIEAEARRMQALVSRMEELRDVETGTIHPELRPVLILPLLGEAGRIVQGLVGGHPVSLSADRARVLADPVRFGQALRNVLSNAARYAPAGTPIAVTGQVVAPGAYQVTIDDEGPGIPEPERRRVLQRYARGSAAGQQAGQGLGLYLASRIIEAHHGSIALLDSPGGGTRVVLTLRLARTGELPHQAEPSPVPETG